MTQIQLKLQLQKFPMKCIIFGSHEETPTKDDTLILPFPNFFYYNLGPLLMSFCVFLQLESIPIMVQGVWSEDPAAQVEATTHFRKLLSIGISLFCCFWV